MRETTLSNQGWPSRDFIWDWGMKRSQVPCYRPEMETILMLAILGRWESLYLQRGILIYRVTGLRRACHPYASKEAFPGPPSHPAPASCISYSLSLHYFFSLAITDKWHTLSFAYLSGLLSVSPTRMWALWEPAFCPFYSWRLCLLCWAEQLGVQWIPFSLHWAMCFVPERSMA